MKRRVLSGIQPTSQITIGNFLGAIKLFKSFQDNDDFYQKTNTGMFVPVEDFKKAYESKNNITLTIKGVVCEKVNSFTLW